MNDGARSGIYVIVNTITGDEYVGSSIDVGTRMGQHRALLNAGKHHIRGLQEDWSTFGESAFIFDVLEAVHDHARLVAAEQRHLDARQPRYNLARIATNAASGVPARSLRQHTSESDHQKAFIEYAKLRAQLYSRLQCNDDVASILLAFDSLTPSGVFQVYSNRDLAITAYQHGVLSGRDFLVFLEAGYRGLYQETQQQIRERKGLRRGQDISDYMDSLETAANIFRAALARQLLADRAVTALPAANATHHEAGDSVRSLLVAKGIYPEQSPTPTKSYQQLLREE